MERVLPLNDGDFVTTEWLQSIPPAIEELQRLAITKVQPPLVRQSKTLQLASGQFIGFGIPQPASSSSSSSSSGADYSGNVTIQINWSIPTIIGTDFTVIGSNLVIPSSAIIAYTKGSDGKYYVLGQPRLIISNIQWNSPSLQMKQRYDFGLFMSTETDWQNIDTAVVCNCTSSSSSSSSPSSSSSSSSSSSRSSSTPATTITVIPCDVAGNAL